MSERNRRAGEPGARGADQVSEIALADAKEEAIDVLAECFARDRLTVEDFERRVGIVHASRSMPELAQAVAGIRTSVPAPAEGTGSASVEALQRMTPDVPASRVRDSDRTLAVFGEANRAGRWIPARDNTFVAAMGSAVVDLRDAQLGPGECRIKAVTFLGSIEVLVPPGLQVECAGSAIFGSFGDSPGERSPPLDPDAPVVRIVGLAVLGSVEVARRRPGESKRQTRRRLRREAKEAERAGRREAKEAKRTRRVQRREARRRLR